MARAARLSLENSQRQSAREPGLEVEETNPFRRNHDSYHLLNHRAELLYPSLSLLASEIALGSNGVFVADLNNGAPGASHISVQVLPYPIFNSTKGFIQILQRISHAEAQIAFSVFPKRSPSEARNARLFKQRVGQFS